MKEQIKEIETLAEDILQEYTNCYSEVDKEVLANMIYNALFREQRDGCGSCKHGKDKCGSHRCGSKHCGSKMKGGAE